MPFSTKQQEYLMNATRRWNFKTGATRSGKTFIDYAFVIPRRITRCTGNGLIVLMGNTQGSLSRNVLEPMRNIWGEKLVGSIRSSDNTVQLFGRKVFALGADKKNRVATIQGSGMEYCYGDEVATWAEDVFTMLKSRLDKPNSRFDGTCNPDYPQHWVKKFLDSKADIYHQHYTIDDNPFLTPEFVANLKQEYMGTVYYDRYILGQWKRAEGAVYRLFADNPGAYLIDSSPSLAFCTVGVDFGGNGSAHAFNLTGFEANLNYIVTLDEEYIKKPLTPAELEAAFVQFIRRNLLRGYPIVGVYADSAEQVLINGLRGALARAGIAVKIHNARKGETRERFRFYNMLFSFGRYKIMRHCTHTAEAFSQAVFDPKKQEDIRLDDGTSNIDSLDAQEYSTEPYQGTLIKLMREAGGYQWT